MPTRGPSRSGGPTARTGRGAAGDKEFLALIIGMMAAPAMGIDMMLPAFPEMRAEFGMSADSTEVGWTVTAYFLGMALGPWLYGPASDRFGRRRPLLAGLALYVVSALVAAIAPTWGLLVASRFVWGLGAAAPRTLSLAIVRDRYEGDAMARLMSLIMSVFMLVPVVAPGLGAALIRIAPWPIVFWFPAICGAALIVWIRRLPETHAAAHRRPFTWRAVGLGARELATHRQSASFTLATMFLFGVMVSYLTGFELVIEDAYGLGEWFPLLFGIIATVLALSSLNNARLVARLGVRELVRRMAITGVATSALIVVVSSVRGGHPPVWLLVLVLCVGLPLSHGLTPNCNTMALTPLPHVAGTASAIMATVTTAGGSVLASVATGAYDGTTRPLGLSIATYFTLAAVLIVWGSARTGGATSHDWVAVVERHSSGEAMAGTGDAAPGR